MDFFVVTDAVVVLVEVKSARPIRATRLGEPSGDDDTAKKVGHAFEQIERSAELVGSRHSALASIPADRPAVGLVVTLEPFHLVNTDWYSDVLVRPSIPTTVVSAHELESTIAVLRAQVDVGERILNALSNGTPANPVHLSAAGADLENVPNPLLSAAWDRFSAPWSAAELSGNGNG